MKKIVKPFIKHLEKCECHPVTDGMAYGGYHINCIRPHVPHIYRLENTDLNEINNHLLYTWQTCKEKVGSGYKQVWIVKCKHSPCGTVGEIEDHSKYWSLKTFKRHLAEQHPAIGRFVGNFCLGCEACKGDGIEVDRHIPVCSKLGEAYDPMKY